MLDWYCILVLPRNEWNGIVTIEVTEGGKAAAGATAVQDLAECRPFFLDCGRPSCHIGYG